MLILIQLTFKNMSSIKSTGKKASWRKTMKYSIILIIILILPLQVFAMDPITDAEMNNITGAVGVHIYVEGENNQPAYQVLQWQNNSSQNDEKSQIKKLNQSIHDIYEISYDDCELRFDLGKTEEDGLWINGKEAVAANRSFIKIGSPTSAPELSTGNIHLNFKDGAGLGAIDPSDMTVSIPQTPDAIFISPR